MSDEMIFLFFLVGWFALGVVAGVILALCGIRWATRVPTDDC